MHKEWNTGILEVFSISHFTELQISLIDKERHLVWEMWNISTIWPLLANFAQS